MRIRINLLDWRAARRQRRKQRFLSLLGLAAAASALLVVAGLLSMNAATDRQQARNQFLGQQVAELDAQIREIQELEKLKANLLARMRVIEQLQQSRSATVHFFDELLNTLPDGVHVTSIKQSGVNVTIDGIAESNARISAYLRNLDLSPWFRDPKLVVIKSAEHSLARNSEFTLQVTNLTRPAPERTAVAANPP